MWTAFALIPSIFSRPFFTHPRHFAHVRTFHTYANVPSQHEQLRAATAQALGTQALAPMDVMSDQARAAAPSTLQSRIMCFFAGVVFVVCASTFLFYFARVSYSNIFDFYISLRAFSVHVLR